MLAWAFATAILSDAQLITSLATARTAHGQSGTIEARQRGMGVVDDHLARCAAVDDMREEIRAPCGRLETIEARQRYGPGRSGYLIPLI